jgi:hypothetical protein
LRYQELEPTRYEYDWSVFCSWSILKVPVIDISYARYCRIEKKKYSVKILH